jgi:hypothetical protein
VMDRTTGSQGIAVPESLLRKSANMDNCRPDFIVIGAMKSATTTLHEQLARQPGFFMSRPKEPNFFSDDPVFARGIDWYRSLFRDAGPGDLRGESSTHYTKLPKYPRAVERMVRALPTVKLIYVIRHPIDRLISHYVHERSVEGITVGIDEAIDAHPELIDYGLFSVQVRPYLDAYGPENVLPVFFDRLVAEPQAELERICRFLGFAGTPAWDASLKPQNVGSERLRRSVLREALVQAPVLSAIRRRFVPKPWTEPVKALWRIKDERPRLARDVEERLIDAFDPDLVRLGRWLGIDLHCTNFHEVTAAAPYNWVRYGAPARDPALAR